MQIKKLRSYISCHNIFIFILYLFHFRALPALSSGERLRTFNTLGLRPHFSPSGAP